MPASAVTGTDGAVYTIAPIVHDVDRYDALCGNCVFLTHRDPPHCARHSILPHEACPASSLVWVRVSQKPVTRRI